MTTKKLFNTCKNTITRAMFFRKQGYFNTILVFKLKLFFPQDGLNYFLTFNKYFWLTGKEQRFFK